MRRREVIAGLAGALAAWPVSPHAQLSGRLPVIGFLGPTSSSVASERVAVFEQRLRELGWEKGRTVSIEYRWAEGRDDRFEEIARELVQLGVAVITTWGTGTALAAKRATSVTPIVFTIVGDPVGSGLVSSLARPTGNVTGLSTQHADASGKRLEILREALPKLRRLAIMANVENTGGVLEMREAQIGARQLGLETVQLELRRVEEIAPAIEALQGRAGALYVVSEALFNANRILINSSALAARLPTMHGFREIVAAGGLLSYGPDYLDLFRRTGDYVDKVLRGISPASIPVEQPTKFELVVNLGTAKALELEIPPTLLARADYVID